MDKKGRKEYHDKPSLADSSYLGCPTSRKRTGTSNNDPSHMPLNSDHLPQRWQ